MKDEYGSALENQVELTGFFQLIPAIGTAKNIELVTGGGIAQCGVYATWEIAIDKASGKHCLRLKDKDGICTVLFLDSTGTFRGRDRVSNGTVLLRPLPIGTKAWIVLSDPSRYWQSQAPDKTESSFFYREALSKQYDWTPYVFDLSERVNKEWLPQSNTAIAIIAANRPGYLTKMVQALAMNKEAHDLPIFAFLDRPIEQSQLEVVEAQALAIRSVFPKSVIIRRPRNFGCGRNIIDARRQLFDKLQYDRVFIFEDDMVPSMHYVGITMRLMNWAESRYSNVGAVQAWNMCKMSLPEKIAYKNAVKTTLTNWWGYLMSRKAWDSIKDLMYRYEVLFLGGDYALRPHRSIKEWFRLKHNKVRTLVPGNQFPPHPMWDIEKKAYFDDPPSGQDAATMFLFYQIGWERLCTVVNRGIYIGKDGIHMNPRMFIQHGYNDIMLHEMSDDDKLEHFILAQDVVAPIPDESPIDGFKYIDNRGVL